jgi:hypothetical protein
MKAAGSAEKIPAWLALLLAESASVNGSNII